MSHYGAIMIYISVPYTGTPEQVQERMNFTFAYFAYLANQQLHAMSPVLIGHQLIARGIVTPSHDFWLPYSREMIRLSDEIHVLTVSGFDSSRGVTFEVTEGLEFNKPVIFVDPIELLPHLDQHQYLTSVISSNVS